jgi:outer membrane protein assembly factor BamD (BamD/ComL family)
VIAIVNDDCEGGQKLLGKLEGVQGYSLVYERLLARTYLCIAKPNPKKAAEHYAAADKEVKKVQSNLIQAEIYTEWAPLLIASGNLEDAVTKLEDAVQFSSQAPWISAAAKRNLAVALYRRGWKRLKDGKSSEAASDFERAGREPSLLQGTEPLAFEFSYALALLDKGDTTTAAKLFKSLAAKGQQSSYLKPPYSKNGTTFFAAYASYRSGTIAQRTQAAKEFESLASNASGSFAQKIKDLLASSYEYVAYDAWKNGKEGAAQKALTAALKYADGDAKKRIQNNRGVLDGTKSASTFENLGSSPPEALVNLGVAYDRDGKPKEAYEAWTKAVAKGVSSKDLKKWIDAKKRIYGFN